jgi:hypothetical protein
MESLQIDYLPALYLKKSQIDYHIYQLHLDLVTDNVLKIEFVRSDKPNVLLLNWGHSPYKTLLADLL